MSLEGFHRDWLARYELPLSSQELLGYYFDRDSTVTGLSVLLARNPALPAVLGQFLDDKVDGLSSEKRTIEFIVSRIGLDSVRKLVLDHQVRLHWRLSLGLEVKKRIEFQVASRFIEKVEMGSSRIAYGDSAFLAGALWDFLNMKELAPRERTWVESRLGLALESTEKAIQLAEELKGFPAKRWLAACLSSIYVAEAILGVLDSAFAEKVLLWERRGVPRAVQALMKSRHLGFSVHAAASWVCTRIAVLEPMSDLRPHDGSELR
ncbi:hypothetical protein EBZ37_00765 [bacterium]|nr:hypothetical protein [bacterium]